VESIEYSTDNNRPALADANSRNNIYSKSMFSKDSDLKLTSGNTVTGQSKSDLKTSQELDDISLSITDRSQSRGGGVISAS
jgi:hypothetical protein